MNDWHTLTRLTNGRPLVVERVRLADSGIAIEGQFTLPVLASLSDADQVFVAAFVHAHGSIKEMERLFGVSYPTVKNRLNALSAKLDALRPEPVQSEPESRSLDDLLSRLESGQITADEALKELQR